MLNTAVLTRSIAFFTSGQFQLLHNLHLSQIKLTKQFYWKRSTPLVNRPLRSETIWLIYRWETFYIDKYSNRTAHCRCHQQTEWNEYNVAWMHASSIPIGLKTGNDNRLHMGKGCYVSQYKLSYSGRYSTFKALVIYNGLSKTIPYRFPK